MKTIFKKITQREIAKSAKIRPDFFNHILHGRRPCPRDVARRLEAATGIDKATWVWGKPEDIRSAVKNYMTATRAASSPT